MSIEITFKGSNREVWCVSTDAKPTTMPTGTWLQEADTGNQYYWNGTVWVQYGHQSFPVGAVFLAVVSTNPNTLLGYGTWAQIGQGRFLAGFDGTDTDFNVVEKTGGAKTHTHTGHVAHVFTQAVAHVFTQPSAHLAHVFTQAVAHLVTQPNSHTDVTNHVHVQSVNSGTTGGLSGYTPDTSTSTSTASGYSTANPTSGGVTSQVHTGTAVDAHSGAGVDAHSAHAGGAVDAHSGAGVDAHSAHDAPSHLPPYLVVYIWKRTV